MEKITKLLENLKQAIIDYKEKVMTYFKEREERLIEKNKQAIANKQPRKKSDKSFLEILIEKKELVLLSVLSVVVLVLFLTIAGPRINHSIILKQNETLIGQTFEGNKKVKVVAYDELEDIIKKNKKVTVMMVDQNGKHYEQLEKSLLDSKELNKYDGTIYLYPITMNKDKIEKFYHLKSDFTMLRFENNKEVNRIPLTTKDEAEEELVNYLITLEQGERPQIGEKNKQKQKELREQKEREEKRKENEDIIDELQDFIL
ncbi:hypothetical protein [Vagococcus fessus]|uniref:Uncharacterized protein n=1 Tax=Vagococcus fessus TaxID=120370 RepID=A0A430ACB4_9ENTE|nr:hypothetical protein [Vagococcus fessus]RSU04843.1 hypothetical protein CBF31_02155 [Vagococcus fessus]